ncbi:MAG: phosphate/phosphite/phosphonate ABC transporter substrate-binding protein [Nodosilinea sp.]
MTIGVVSYGETEVSLERYQRFQAYLAEQTKIPIDLEVAYNELKAVQEIDRSNWDIVFAPPGLAAIADKRGYTRVFTLENLGQAKFGLIVVRADSDIDELGDLQDQVVALGERGSAAGYYLPLYDLYGLTLQEARFAPTPKTVLEWLDAGTVAAGALSESDFENYQASFDAGTFRILHRSRAIPAGVVLMGGIERNQAEFITRVMKEAPADITSDARYVSNANLPSYDHFIQIVEKVRPLEDRVQQQPATLTLDDAAVGTEAGSAAN